MLEHVRVTDIYVFGLFGHTTHKVGTDPEGVTIITAPNGAGKTHLMRLAVKLLQLDLAQLLSEPFSELQINFSDGSSLAANREISTEGSPLIALSAKSAAQSASIQFGIDDSRRLEALDASLPGSFVRESPFRWASRLRLHEISVDRISAHSGPEHSQAVEMVRQVNHFRSAFKFPEGVLIDTKRLYESPFTKAERSDRIQSTATSVHPASPVARMNVYITQLRRQLTRARRETVDISQRADMNIANRLMDAATASVKEESLRRRYQDAVQQQELLARNSLAIVDAPVPLPFKMNPTQRRILKVVLDDWERRLAPLVPLNEKIDSLRRILDDKLGPSGKSTLISTDGELQFQDLRRRKISVGTLSSGEQHLVALYTSLLFATAEGALVCIDEPELSLHAAWQHAFVDEILEVATLARIQIVLATHSTAIINGRWDITRPLDLQMPEPLAERFDENAADYGSDEGDEDFDF